MNKFIDIALLILMIGVFIATFILMKDEERGKSISSINITIENGDSVRLVTKKDIEIMLKSDMLKNWSTLYSSCDPYQIEKELSKLNYINSVESYKMINGVLNIDIKQKNVVLRIRTDSGKDLYIDDKLTFLPTVEDFVLDVPVLTCDDEFLLHLQESGKNNKKVEKNYYILHNLLNFVRLIESDQFWKSMIVQLNISKSRELQLVPRVGSHLVVLCDCSDIGDALKYLQKLGGFYTKIVASQGWSKYKIINTKYDNIVVATKQ